MMTELSDEKIDEYVTEIVDWKKDRDKDWSEIERTLQRLNDELVCDYINQVEVFLK